MRTHFSPSQVLAPEIAGFTDIIRNGVHSGFYTNTSPTDMLTPDESDAQVVASSAAVHGIPLYPISIGHE